MATTPTAQARGPDPDAMVADLQRANAALRQQIEERDAEHDAALAREAALAEGLQVVNASTGDLGPVFETISQSRKSRCLPAGLV